MASPWAPANADRSAPTQLTHGDARNWGPSWSPDGTKIAFGTTRDGEFDIYLMNPDGSGQARLMSHAGTNDTFPALSPDGKKIVFTSWDDALDAASADVYVMNADGSGRTRLTTNPTEDFLPELVAGRQEDRLPGHPRQRSRDLRDERRRLRADEAHEQPRRGCRCRLEVTTCRQSEGLSLDITRAEGPWPCQYRS